MHACIDTYRLNIVCIAWELTYVYLPMYIFTYVRMFPNSSPTGHSIVMQLRKRTSTN